MDGVKNYKIVRSRRKTVALHVTDSAELIVRAPNYVSKFFITSFVKQNVGWIKRRREDVLRKKASQKKYVDGEMHMFIGRLLPLYIVRSNDKKLSLVSDNGFFLSDNLTDPKKEFVKWYRKQARIYITERAQKLAKEHNFSYS